jgi:hypothetical protein
MRASLRGREEYNSSVAAREAAAFATVFRLIPCIIGLCVSCDEVSPKINSLANKHLLDAASTFSCMRS